MMDDDCLAVSGVAPSVSSSYSTEPVSAVTAKRVQMKKLQSSEAYPSTYRRDNCTRMSNSRRGQRVHEYQSLFTNFKSCLRT